MGDAKWGQIKMKAVGFPKEKRHGMKNRYNFRFEKALGEDFVYCFVTCSCTWCYKKLQEGIETKYEGPRNGCYLWPIFDKKDGSG